MRYDMDSMQTGALGDTPTPEVPVHDRIRALAQEIAEAADHLAERRQAYSHARRDLDGAEKRFELASQRMTDLLAQHRGRGALNDPNHKVVHTNAVRERRDALDMG